MPSGISLGGFGSAFRRLRLMQRAVERGDTATVVADAPHAPKVELGTRHRPATPYFRPGLRRTRTGNLGDPKQLFELVFGGRDSVADRLAEDAERNIEREIRDRGLVDTGELLASVHTEDT